MPGVQVSNQIALCNQGHAAFVMSSEPQSDTSATVAAKAARFEVFKESLISRKDDIMRKLAHSNPGAFALPPETADAAKFSRQLPIPHREHPTLNFVGWLMGTGGRTRQELERRTGAKVAIR